MSDEEPPAHAQSTVGKTIESERWTGTIFTFLSVFFYGISNVVVRYLTEYNVDHSWMLFYKEFIGLAILLPWLFFRWGQGRFRHTSTQLMLYIFLAAIVCQLIGAQLHVLGFAIIGLIITVPLVQSSTLLGVAFIGHFIFRHRLSRRRKTAIMLLIISVTILSIGKEMIADSQGSNADSAGLFLLVAAGAVVTGIAYAIYITILRYVVRQHWDDENSTRQSFRFRHWIGHDVQHQIHHKDRFYSPFPVTLLMAIVLGVGVMIFGASVLYKYGMPGFFTVPVTSPGADWEPSIAWYCMLISGISNVTGFLFQVQGLRMTSALQASLIAVSQMLLLSLVGFLLFHEAVNVIVMIGLGLTVYGVLMSAKPER